MSDEALGTPGPETTGTGPQAPLLRIVRGEPTDAEVVALTLVLAAAGGGGEGPAPRPRERWGDPAARLRAPLRPGPGAWSASARTR